MKTKEKREIMEVWTNVTLGMILTMLILRIGLLEGGPFAITAFVLFAFSLLASIIYEKKENAEVSP